MNESADKPGLQARYQNRRSASKGLATRIIGGLAPLVLVVVAIVYSGGYAFPILLAAASLLLLVVVVVWSRRHRS